MNLVDPTGEIAETWWDALNVIYDAGKIVKNGVEMGYEWARNAYGTVTNNQALIDDSQKWWEQDKKELKEWLIDAWTNVVATAIPFAPAGAAKVARAVDKLNDASKTWDKTKVFNSIKETWFSWSQRTYYESSQEEKIQRYYFFQSSSLQTMSKCWAEYCREGAWEESISRNDPRITWKYQLESERKKYPREFGNTSV